MPMRHCAQHKDESSQTNVLLAHKSPLQAVELFVSTLHVHRSMHSQPSQQHCRAIHQSCIVTFMHAICTLQCLLITSNLHTHTPWVLHGLQSQVGAQNHHIPDHLRDWLAHPDVDG